VTVWIIEDICTKLM